MSKFSAIVCLGSFAAFSPACLAQTSAALKTSKQPEKRGFVAVDTSRLMGLPDAHEVLGVENAFPHLSFSRPVEVTHAGDGSNRLFVVEQDGVIRVLVNDSQTKEAQIFLDLKDAVRREHNEEGLLGLAFHPKYRENGELFVFYSVTPRGSRVSRFKVSKDDPNKADRSSEEKLLEYPKPYGNHNGGCLKFGPDGFLYISIGDGGLANDPHENGQNLETIFGKILRIDVNRKEEGRNYAIPQDNPFVERGAKVRGEIWAYGPSDRIASKRSTSSSAAATTAGTCEKESTPAIRIRSATPRRSS